MSVLTELEDAKKMLGINTWRQIISFLTEHPEYYLHDVLYRETIWNKFEKWRNPSYDSKTYKDICQREKDKFPFLY